MKSLIPPVLFLICLLVMAILRWQYPLMTLFGFPFNLLGLVPLFLGMIVGGLGARTFSRVGTNIKPYKEPGVFVTSGVFRYSRNPMYLGLSLALLGIWILLKMLTPIIGVLIFVIVTDRWYIRYEEKMLREKFGAAYEEYQSRTRRWI